MAEFGVDLRPRIDRGDYNKYKYKYKYKEVAF